MPKATGKALLHEVQFGVPARVARLLESGAPVNFQDDGKCTALLFAASRGDYELSDLCLKHGADPNLQDDRRMTALHWAVTNEDERMIDLLLAHGADPWLENDVGSSPVSVAEHLWPDLAKRLKKAKKKSNPVKNPVFQKLARKLRGIAGKTVQQASDKVMQRMLDSGHVFPIKGLIKERGRIGECHENVAAKFEKTWQAKGAVIASGYALSDDTWYLHSWLWHKERIVETTLVRAHYFGIVLTPSEAKRLCAE